MEGKTSRVGFEEGATRKEPRGQEPRDGTRIGYLELDVPCSQPGSVFREYALKVSEKPSKPSSSQLGMFGYESVMGWGLRMRGRNEMERRWIFILVGRTFRRGGGESRK